MSKKKKILSIVLSSLLVMQSFFYMFNFPTEVSVDGAMSGNSWGTGTSGNIILTKQTVLRLGFDVREFGSYKDFGYKSSYPALYKGYSIMVGTCGNTYSSSPYSNNVVLAPTASNDGTIDYIEATNMFLSRPQSGLTLAIWDLALGGTSSYTGDGVTALKTGKVINLNDYLGVPVADSIRAKVGSDWNIAKFHEGIQWEIPLNENAEMKENAMAMVLIAEYLNERGAGLDTKEIFQYYTRQGAKKDYILVLENFHGAMASSNKQPFFTHQNYIFDTVTGYHKSNYARAGTVADWFNEVKDIQAQPITLTYSGNNLTELYATGNANNPTRQLFCQFFASRGGKLAGNRMALSAYFYRKALYNSEIPPEILAELSPADPLRFWYTKQYDKHTDLGDAWANDFTRYKTGFAVFKAVPPIAPTPDNPSVTEPKGGHTLVVQPASKRSKDLQSFLMVMMRLKRILL